MILNKIKNNLNTYLFNLQCKKIRDTPPIQYHHKSDIKIVTQVHHAALDMYLVAIKSFLYHFGSGSVEVLSDGTLTTEDKEILRQHIPKINITEITAINVGTCPKGGTWERLVFISNLSKMAYVIQLDSDTLTLSPVPEIQDAIVTESGFTIGNPRWPIPVTTSYLSDVTSKWNSNHVQVCAEKIFHQLDFFMPSKKYIRGCSAFAGFPKNQMTLPMLENFSQQVSRVIGIDKWAEWGSEQVSSNVMVAQTTNSFVLPWPRYQNYEFPVSYQDSIQSAALIHFIGSNRYSNRQYEKLAKSFIKSLTNINSN